MSLAAAHARFELDSRSWYSADMFSAWWSHWRSRKTLRVVIYNEQNRFVAQCLEYDVCAQGKSIPDAIKHIHLALLEIRDDSLRRHGRAFAHIDQAPPQFHKMWQDGIADMQPRPHAKAEFLVPPFTMACAIR